ncbi:MAG: rhomboid family intramembrane serine protease [Chitinivibrionales bacterium]|nr:rhomboid family intramembrane serine protease [Chitinivibrionales bacterium]
MSVWVWHILCVLRNCNGEYLQSPRSRLLQGESMFPIRDNNPTLKKPIVTWIIIGINCFIWGAVQRFGAHPFLIKSICNFGLIPGELLGTAAPGTIIPVSRTFGCMIGESPNWSTLFSSMFLHAGWLHIISNMWFLWIFGDNVEDAFGRFKFILVYLLSGLIAAAAQLTITPSSVVPMVGASGAIGGVMGAYAILYPRAKIEILIFLGFYVARIDIPAIFVLGYWFMLQLFSALPTIGMDGGGGVAFWAHIGGFLMGIATVNFFRVRPRPRRKWQ